MQTFAVVEQPSSTPRMPVWAVIARDTRNQRHGVPVFIVEGRDAKAVCRDAAKRLNAVRLTGAVL